jgi:hypothetical protein
MNESYLSSLFTILFHLSLIAIYFAHKYHYFTSPTVSEGQTNLPTSNTANVKDVLSEISLKSTHFTSSPCSRFQTCLDLPFEDSSRNISILFRTYKENRLPVAFSLSDRKVTWKAFDWNLWNFTQTRWPILENVLEVNRNADANEPGLFLTAEDNFVAENISTHASSDSVFPEEFSSYSIHQEMFFWDFLNYLLPNKTSREKEVSSDVCRYFSTNYRIFESYTNV